MKWFDKYLQDVKVNKWVAVKFGVVVSVIAFIISYMYNTLTAMERGPREVVAIAIGVIWFPLWLLLTYSLERRNEKILERRQLEKEKEIEERRKKYDSNGKRINNKKKKKLRRQNEMKDE